MKPNSREGSNARATLAGHAPVTQSEGPVGSRFVITTPARTLPESARRIPYLHFWGWVVKTRPTRDLRTADDNDDFVPDKRCPGNRWRPWQTHSYQDLLNRNLSISQSSR